MRSHLSIFIPLLISMKRLFPVLLILICFAGAKAQHSAIRNLPIPKPGYDPRLEILLERYNKTHEIRGYRIQIISSSKKELARKAMSRFASLYQDIEAYEVYQQPFFIIKVGDFLTKLEAVKVLREIESEFPGSFVLPDKITPLKQYTKDKKP